MNVHHLSLHSIAHSLGGHVSRGGVLCPGPGHKAKDRSLSIRLSATAPDGFVVHSFAHDDAMKCRDYVRERLGLPPFTPRGNARNTQAPNTGAPSGGDPPRKSNNERDGELVSPIPDDAPGRPKNHSKLGRPTVGWEYRDAAGELLLAVYRFDRRGQRKMFLPLSLWRDADGTLAWRWKGVPAPRPLYGLNWLSTNPGLPVIVCEGEKSAHAAWRIFSDFIATTSLGGAQAAAKADWSPLAGRRVTIWPDADEPGAKYAAQVASILHGLGCDVSIIDAIALASVAPDGDAREPEPGWDAADAIAEWGDKEALRQAALGLAMPFDADDRASGDVTEAPRPLRRQLSPAKPFPINALGQVLGAATRAIIDKVQCADAVAACSVLAAASLAVQAHADVVSPATGRARPASLYLCTVAATGDRKSAADYEALTPIRAREEALREAYEAELPDYKRAKRAFEVATV
jgi:hypothetical protein